jgi:drug/metabolite transporter (DMT)-like permease
VTAGVAWALVAAVGFGFLQAFNRKSNQLVDAFRTAFGLLAAVEVLLVARAVVSGEIGLVTQASWKAVVLFATATFFHFAGGWTLLALSQQRIGVARTGALVSAAPLVGTLLAAPVLSEPLTVPIVGGVLLAVSGVALISLSGMRNGRSVRVQPWLALTVALIWGSSPMLIRLGLERFDHPVLGLTIGLAVSVPLYGLLLVGTGVARRQRVSGLARRWIMAGGVAGAIGVSGQWLSFGLTTIAIALTVQQLAALVVVALVPLMFREPFERMNLVFGVGTAGMLAGSILVVLAGR